MWCFKAPKCIQNVRTCAQHQLAISLVKLFLFDIILWLLLNQQHSILTMKELLFRILCHVHCIIMDVHFVQVCKVWPHSQCTSLTCRLWMPHIYFHVTEIVILKKYFKLNSSSMWIMTAQKKANLNRVAVVLQFKCFICLVFCEEWAKRLIQRSNLVVNGLLPEGHGHTVGCLWIYWKWLPSWIR